MKTINKIKRRIEREFKQIIKEFPQTESLSCDININNAEEFVFVMRNDVLK